MGGVGWGWGLGGVRSPRGEVRVRWGEVGVRWSTGRGGVRSLRGGVGVVPRLPARLHGRLLRDGDGCGLCPWCRFACPPAPGWD